MNKYLLKYQITQLLYHNSKTVVVVSAKVVIWKLAKKGPKVAYPLIERQQTPKRKKSLSVWIQNPLRSVNFDAQRSDLMWESTILLNIWIRIEINKESNKSTLMKVEKVTILP